MLHKKFIISLVCFSFTLPALPNVSFAADMESITHLTSLAKEFIQKTIALDTDEALDVKLGEAANHLQLAQCKQPIQVTIPANSTSQQISTLEMSCVEQGWHVYVPIDMKIMTNVVVAKQTIPAKEIISEDMLDFAQHDKNSLFSGYYKNAKEIVGQIPTATIYAGTVLTKKNVQQPILINRGQSVSIISRRAGILVKAEGIAKSNGAFNDTIKILNPSSKRLIDATVVSSSSVEVR